jgi:hypothetical protein
MNTLIKARVGTKSNHAAIESVEVNPVVGPLLIPVAANSDWFEDLVSDLFDIPAYDNEPWVDESLSIEETWSRVQDIRIRLARQRQPSVGVLLCSPKIAHP